MRALLFSTILSLSMVSKAAELTCTVFSASRGGISFLGFINTSAADQAKFVLTKSGALISSSEIDKLSTEDKLSSITIAFSNRNNNSNEPYVVIGQVEKVEGTNMIYDKPLLSSLGTSDGLNVNYLDKDIAIICGR